MLQALQHEMLGDNGRSPVLTVQLHETVNNCRVSAQCIELWIQRRNGCHDFVCG
jgi:hypothetical protein